MGVGRGVQGAGCGVSRGSSRAGWRRARERKRERERETISRWAAAASASPDEACATCWLPGDNPPPACAFRGQVTSPKSGCGLRVFSIQYPELRVDLARARSRSLALSLSLSLALCTRIVDFRGRGGRFGPAAPRHPPPLIAADSPRGLLLPPPPLQRETTSFILASPLDCLTCWS